jgi:hypothetical protein
MITALVQVPGTTAATADRMLAVEHLAVTIAIMIVPLNVPMIAPLNGLMSVPMNVLAMTMSAVMIVNATVILADPLVATPAPPPTLARPIAIVAIVAPLVRPKMPVQTFTKTTGTKKMSGFRGRLTDKGARR